MKNMFTFRSIRSKLIFGFSIIILLIIMLGVYNHITIKKMNSTAEAILDKELPMLIADENLLFTVSSRTSTARGYILSGESNFKELFNDYAKQGNQEVEIIERLGSSERFDEITVQLNEWNDYIVSEVFEVYDAGDEKLAQENLLNADASVREVVATYEELIAAKEAAIIELEETIVSDGKTTLLVETIVTIVVILVALAVALITSGSIARPIKTVMERMNLFAQGDLSQERLETVYEDEIGQLIVATNEAQQNTRDLLNSIHSVANTVNVQSEELTQSASEVRAGSEQVAVTMEDLASGSESQANHTTELSERMSNFSTKVEETNENGLQIGNITEQVLLKTNEGAELMESSSKQMSMIDQIVQQAVQQVVGLDENAQGISQLVSVIQDIADQTNLLALNAAIEAARAGEHGQGFAVVADEVRKLAEQVSVSVTDITGFVDNIQAETSEVTESLQSGYKEVEQGTSQIATTKETFHDISSSITEMANNIQHIVSNLSDITEDSTIMNSSIQEIAAISEESAAGIEETSAQSEQSSSAMDEITANSSDLASLADELNELMNRFKL